MYQHLEIVGEASSKISENVRKEYSAIPWKQIIGLRNIVVHEYFRVDAEEIWKTIQQDLPALKQQVQAILSRLENT